MGLNMDYARKIIIYFIIIGLFESFNTNLFKELTFKLIGELSVVHKSVQLAHVLTVHQVQSYTSTLLLSVQLSQAEAISLLKLDSIQQLISYTLQDPQNLVYPKLYK